MIQFDVSIQIDRPPEQVFAYVVEGSMAEALARLKSAGGGVLYFPRGRYLVSQTLSIRGTRRARRSSPRAWTG